MPRLIGYSLPPTGSRIGFTGLVAPTGWVFGAGKTIGNVASGGTERASADTFGLYELLWNSYTNVELPIQTSGGIGTTRGVSADADFAANKRMPTPDYRGRVGFGKDNLGGSPASRITAGVTGITGTTLGATGGLESIAQHQHGPGTLSASSGGTHTHTMKFSNGTGGNVGVEDTGDAGGSFTTGIPSGTAEGSHGHSVDSGQTAATGSGISGGHGNIQPAISESIIIKL